MQISNRYTGEVEEKSLGNLVLEAVDQLPQLIEVLGFSSEVFVDNI